MINEVKTQLWTTTSQISNSTQQSATQAKQEASSTRSDVLEISDSGRSAVLSTNSSKEVETSNIEELKEYANTATENLRSLVEKLLLKQGKGASIDDNYASLLDLDNVKNSTYLSDADAVAQAQNLISEDGELGVKAVSDRLVNFAIAVSGGDTTKLDELKSAIDEGFAQAKKAFGGTLPDICNQTYDATMKKLDDWSKQSSEA